jgi:hypothetical protein
MCQWCVRRGGEKIRKENGVNRSGNRRSRICVSGVSEEEEQGRHGGRRRMEKISHWFEENYYVLPSNTSV